MKKVEKTDVSEEIWENSLDGQYLQWLKVNK